MKITLIKDYDHYTYVNVIDFSTPTKDSLYITITHELDGKKVTSWVETDSFNRMDIIRE